MPVDCSLSLLTAPQDDQAVIAALSKTKARKLLAYFM